MALRYIGKIYKDWKRDRLLEEKRYLFDNHHQYVLFSGTALGENGDLRHLNDLYFFLFLLDLHKIDRQSIHLVIDTNIITELQRDPQYQYIASIIENKIGNIIDVLDFECNFKRDKRKDLIFLASGHGDINGLYIGKNKSYLTPDYFEDNATYDSRTILVMSQCFAGAFHHLDTRKNICVLGASEYQESLSIPIHKMILDHLHAEKLKEFILAGLAFKPDIPINPFIFAIFTTIMNEHNLKTQKKHLINIYKNSTALTLQYLKNTAHGLKIEAIQAPIEPDGKTEIIFDGSTLIQQPYLLNKIIAARFYLK